MTRLQALDPKEATGRSKELFEGIQGKLGMVPNMMRTMGNSSVVLEGYLNLSDILDKIPTLMFLMHSDICKTSHLRCAAVYDF